MVLVVVLIAGFGFLLHFTPFGRGVYDIGLNAEAARFTGVDVARTKLILFVLSGASRHSPASTSRCASAAPAATTPPGLELQVIAAVLLGGVSIFGGRGRLHGVVAGVLLIGVISSALRLESITVNVINIIIGLLLVASVISPSVLTSVSGMTRSVRRSTRARGPRPVPSGAGETEGKNR